MKLDELLESYLAVNTRIRSPQTVEHYHRSVRQFGAYLGRIPTTDHLTDDHLAGWMVATVRDEGLTEQTANQRAKQIRALWEWAARRRHVERFPTVRQMVEPERSVQAWRPAQVAGLLKSCEAQAGYVGQFHASRWWLALHYTALDSGERAGALWALTRDCYVPSERLLDVPAHIRKGGRKRMVYRLLPRTCDALDRLLEYPRESDLIFETPWQDEQCFYSRYKRLVKQAGLPYVKRKTGLQKLRRTVFTLIAARNGVTAAADFAGHSTSAVTRESYIDQTIVAGLTEGVWPREGAFDAA